MLRTWTASVFSTAKWTTQFGGHGMRNETKTRPGSNSRPDHQSKGTSRKDNTQQTIRSDSANVTKDILNILEKHRFFDLVFIKFENSTPHKYVVQTAKSIWMARSEMTGIHFLSSKNHTNSILKNPVANFCRWRTPQIHTLLTMAGVWPPEIWIVYGLRIQLFLNQSPRTSEAV